MEPPILTSPLLADLPGVRHAFFTRNGGVSQAPYDSLNIGRGSGDDPASVAENRRRAAARFGLAPEALSTCYQTHSAEPVVAERGWGDSRPQGDAVVTRVPGVLCGALAADCAPVLLVDPTARVAAAAHAGWRGAIGGILERTIEAMERLGACRADLVAAVGPTIGPKSYEVGLEFLARFEADDAANARFFAPGEAAEKRLFDLPGFVLARLAAAGVAKAEWIGGDTVAEEALFFSNRRTVRRGASDYGRLLSAIALEP
jgi:YfiH family protein